MARQLYPFDAVTLSAGQFTWTGRKGVAEASDLKAVRDFAYLPTALRLRGRQGDKLFNRVDAIVDNEGDTIAWPYVSPDGFRVEILND